MAYKVVIVAIQSMCKSCGKPFIVRAWDLWPWANFDTCRECCLTHDSEVLS